MLRPDVIDLREFYRTALGQTARRLIRRRIRLLWPSVTGQRVLGLGFATPYLAQFRDEAERIAVAMPVSQGVMHWPSGEPGLAVLAEETELPFADAMFDRVLVVHGIESADNVRVLLREIWRILAPSGRLLAVVPNRRGLWSRFENSPFGQGHPYAPGQLTRLMRDTMFSPTQAAQALYVPPWERRFVLGAANGWEKAGAMLWPRFSGVLLLEAEKQIYAPPPGHAERRKRARSLAWRPAASVSRGTPMNPAAPNSAR